MQVRVHTGLAWQVRILWVPLKVRVEGRRRVEGVVRMMNLLLRVKRRQTHTHSEG